MATNQLWDADDAVLAEAELPTDTEAMAWLVSAATQNRQSLAGKRGSNAADQRGGVPDLLR
ncbi:hypothetical protein QMK17_20510 [Rhodococcus sp. G-MC3]|uniref:hypothetical protein n=1 Tax=Rhodococcus sp. G-MC3 TaxID=3046209 RepID=UPI0024B9F254|nr:hypothetical protein [Rhodococcus sp. G-MC3]MDJ0395708.1 hypothetical protein [Rhodococcus sp. G-MC3]